MKKILLVGKNGQIGWELLRTLAPLGPIVALGRNDMDLANPDSIRRAVREVSPDLIVNAAAYTAVDQAESEPDLAMAVNGVAPGILAEEAMRLNAMLIHFSTDYVFDGRKSEPYREEDQPNPLNVYGKTKLEGERAISAVGCAHLIFRISWIYGARGKNFLLTMLRLAGERDELRVVNDQIGAPTWSRFVAEAVGQALARNSRELAALSGIYHLTAAGSGSWYDFAKEIFGSDAICENRAVLGLRRDGPRIVPISSESYGAVAVRPANSVLSCEKVEEIFGIFRPEWRDFLACCLKDFLVGKGC